MIRIPPSVRCGTACHSMASRHERLTCGHSSGKTVAHKTVWAAASHTKESKLMQRLGGRPPNSAQLPPDIRRSLYKFDDTWARSRLLGNCPTARILPPFVVGSGLGKTMAGTTTPRLRCQASSLWTSPSDLCESILVQKRVRIPSRQDEEERAT